MSETNADVTKGITAKVGGISARFCNEGCQESYACDREHGLIYAPWKVDGKIIGVDEASIALDFCAYCSTTLSDTPEGVLEIN